MMWPLVLRSVLEAEQRHVKFLGVLFAEARDERRAGSTFIEQVVESHRVQVDGLVETITSMRREGFESPQVFPEIEAPKEPDLPVSIWDAIIAVTERGSEEYRACVDFALASMGVAKEEDIAAQIRHGREVEA